MTLCRLPWVLCLAAVLLARLPLTAQSMVNVACPLHDAPGLTVECPVTLTLGQGVTVDGITFAVTVAPNGAAPALTSGQLSFHEAFGAPFKSTGGTNNSISLIWFGLNPPLAGTAYLGSLIFSLPSSAANADQYAVKVTGGSASLGSNTVGLSTSQPLSIAPGNPCDTNGDSSTNVVDVQRIVSEALGLASAVDDLNQDGVINVCDIAHLIAAALGSPCQ